MVKCGGEIGRRDKPCIYMAGLKGWKQTRGEGGVGGCGEQRSGRFPVFVVVAWCLQTWRMRKKRGRAQGQGEAINYL